MLLLSLKDLRLDHLVAEGQLTRIRLMDPGDHFNTVVTDNNNKESLNSYIYI